MNSLMVAVGALDDEEHWYLPPAHARRDLRKSFASASWQQFILLISFVTLSVVLLGLVTTIAEPIYPATSNEEKFSLGIVLLGSEAISAILNLFLAFELWFWTLAFGWTWWNSPSNVLEVGVLLADFGVRMFYSGPPEMARCFGLLVVFFL
jgi:hypothetical protein